MKTKNTFCCALHFNYLIKQNIKRKIEDQSKTKNKESEL